MVMYDEPGGGGGGLPGGTDPANQTGPGQGNGQEGQGGGGDCESQGLVSTHLNEDGSYGETIHCVDSDEAARRREIVYNPPGTLNQNQSGGNATNGPLPPYSPSYNIGAVPQFTPPVFSWGETFNAPSFTDAANDPGYKFRAAEGQRAIENNAASRGNLRTGGTIKALANYNQNLASAEYGNVYARRFGEYGQRYGEAKDKFGFDYTGARDKFAPNLLDWQTRTNAEIQRANLQNGNEWSLWNSNNLTAAQLWAMLNGL